jgi:hypothetical protein
MSLIPVLLAGLAALLLFALLAFRRTADKGGPGPGEERPLPFRGPEELLLQEASVTRTVAPGLVGRAEIRYRGVLVEVDVRASDPAQAFIRGTSVRVIDCEEGCFIVEPAEEEHLVR